MDELFEFHHANILLLEPGGETLKVVASRGYENQAIGGRVRIGTGVIGIVAQKRKMLHVSNLGQQRAYAAAQRRQMMKSGRAGQLGDAGAGPRPAQRREPDRHPAAHPRRADRRVLDREPGAAHVQRARARPRVDRRQPDRERDPQRAAVRGATARRRGAAGSERVARSARRRAHRGARARAARRARAPERSAQPRRGSAARRQRRGPCAARGDRTAGRVDRAAAADRPSRVRQRSRRARGARGVGACRARSSSSAAPSCTRSIDTPPQTRRRHASRTVPAGEQAGARLGRHAVPRRRSRAADGAPARPPRHAGERRPLARSRRIAARQTCG